MLADLFNQCYSGDHQKMPPEQFKQTFCAACQNSGCKNSRTGQSLWMSRMLTQEEILLRNPNFAPEGLGSGLPDFKDMIQRALALEISERKGDWSVASPVEVLDAARELVGLAPTGFVKAPEPVVVPEPEPEPAPPEPVIAPEPQIADRWNVRGDAGDTYEVTRTTDNKWSCSCKAFTFKKSCKHVQDIAAKLARAPEPVPPVPVAHSRPAPFLPPSQNTRMPSGGIMIGGGAPPSAQPEQPDPWAVPERVIKVGAKVVLGGGNKGS
jgi:hypothetical protein